MTLKKKLYLANPYGFSKQSIPILDKFKQTFNKLDIEVYEPFERSMDIMTGKKSWAYDVANSNYNDIKNCDCTFAIANGNPPDEGVMVEIGIAIALKKKIFIFRDDIRKCTDNKEFPLNLMLFIGLPRKNWEKSYFVSIDEIQSDKKDFIKWAT